MLQLWAWQGTIFEGQLFGGQLPDCDNGNEAKGCPLDTPLFGFDTTLVVFQPRAHSTRVPLPVGGFVTIPGHELHRSEGSIATVRLKYHGSRTLALQLRAVKLSNNRRR
jgi:hypothetical protein